MSKYDIFISYSKLDFDEVIDFVSLVKNGVPGASIWFDATNAQTDVSSMDESYDAINNSDNVLFLVSPNAANSVWVKNEVLHASDVNKNIVVVVLKSMKLSGYTPKVEEIDLTDKNQVEVLISYLRCCKNHEINNDALASIVLARTKSKAEQGDAEAQFYLGECYYVGYGVDEDLEEAVKWYYNAAEQGYVNAQFNLGHCYYYGEGIEEDDEEAA